GDLSLQRLNQLHLRVQLSRLGLDQPPLDGDLLILHGQPRLLRSDHRLLPRDHLTQTGVHRPKVSHKSNIIDTTTATINPTRRPRSTRHAVNGYASSIYLG